MIPIKIGQIVKFHTPNEDEDPNQLYVVLELHMESEWPRAYIRPLNTDLSFPPINTVRPKDLEVVEVRTDDLIGHTVTIINAKNQSLIGKVIKAKRESIILNMEKTADGVKTNVHLTIVDEDGIEHEGTFYLGE